MRAATVLAGKPSLNNRNCYTKGSERYQQSPTTYPCYVLKVLLVKLVVLVPEWTRDDELCVQLHQGLDELLVSPGQHREALLVAEPDGGGQHGTPHRLTKPPGDQGSC